MLILIAAGVFIIMAAAIMFLYYRYTKTSESLFTARQDANRSHARHEAAKKAAQEAEERCKQLMRQVNVSLQTTGQALDLSHHVKLISQQLGKLFELIADPDEPGRHEYPLAPGMTPYGLREVPAAEAASLSHAHVDHTRALPVSGYSPPASWTGANRRAG